MQRGFFDLQKKITWFKTYPDFLASPLISNQEKQLYFEIKSNLESPQSEIVSAVFLNWFLFLKLLISTTNIFKSFPMFKLRFSS